MQLVANEPFFVAADKRSLAELTFRALAAARFASRCSLLAFAGPLGLQPDLLDAWIASGLVFESQVCLDPIVGRDVEYLALTRAGARMLADSTGKMVESVAPGALKHSSQKRAHDVVVGDTVLAVLTLAPNGGVELLGIQADPQKVPALGVTLRDGRDTERVRLVPDAYVLTRGPRGPVALLVEVDRGTVSVARMRRKYRAYLTWKREGGPLHDLGVNAVRVLTTAPAAAREKRLHEAAFQASEGRRSGLLLFTLEEHLSASHPERLLEPVALPLGSPNTERVPIFDRPTHSGTGRVVLPQPGPQRQVVRPLAVAASQWAPTRPACRTSPSSPTRDSESSPRFRAGSATRERAGAQTPL